MTAGDIDYLLPGSGLDLGGISRLEVLGRGRNTDLIDDATVALAEARVRKSGVLEKLEQWAAEDGRDPSMGGRPSMISSRAVLTALLLLARESAPMFMRRAGLLLQVRLTPASQELLGLPQDNSAFVDPSVSKDRWFNNTMRAFQRMNALMDPYPQERYTSKTHEQIQAILDAHDPVRAEKYKARLNEYTRLFLRMTIMEQPRAIRRKFKKLDVSFDQTYVGTPTTRGYSHNTIKDKIAVERRIGDFGKVAPGPVDAFTGWHIANGERTDYTRGEVDKTNPKDKANAGKIFEWGWVANLAVRVDSEAPGARRFPALVVAASLSIPNREVAEEAVDLLRNAASLGMEPGVADADKQYWANSVPTRLLRPALETGFTPSTDYKSTRLGIKGGQHGALAVEGDMYCPQTPELLLSAAKDAQTGVIDIPTFRERIKSRKAFALHVKQKAKTPGGTATLRCPALGPSPTVTCALREMMVTAAKKVRPHVEPETVEREFLDTICTQHSAAFDLTAMQQPAQAFDYGSEEWEAFHQHARNTVESENQQLKASGDEDVETAGRRRVRGISAAQIIITLLLVNHNIRKIASFLDDEQRRDRKNAPTGPAPRRRRDAWLNRYIKVEGHGDIRVRNTKDLKQSADPQPLRT